MAKRLPPNISVAAGELDEQGLAGAVALGKKVGVKGAVPGEHVEARVVARRRGRFLALAERVPAAPGKDRAMAPCRYFPKCGGCAIQQLRYAAGLGLKLEFVVRGLRERGLNPAVLPSISAVRLGYRRRARLGVRVLDDELLIGFRESFGNRIVRMNECLTLHPRLSRLIGPLRTVLRELSVARAIPQVELTMGDARVGAVIRHLQPLMPADVDALARFGLAADVVVFTQSGGEESIEPLTPCVEEVTFKYQNVIYGVCFEFGVADFIQVNHRLNERLVLIALLALDLSPGDLLLDLFCGIGNFSLPASRAGARVTGVEMSEKAVARARRNAARNSLGDRTEFFAADIYAADPPGNLRMAYNKVLLDPPRSGVGGRIAAWLPATVERIVYVSCNPTTFVADSSTLLRHGFELVSVRVLDMFPYTSHVETMGVFERIN